MSETIMTRFDKKWHKDSNQCHVWTAGTDRDNYGRFSCEGTGVAAHRWIFKETYGYLPQVVMHTCDNPPCVNPEHLVAGTHETNAKDRDAKGRGARGEQQGAAKLTEEDVRKIRLRYAQNDVSQYTLSIEFGVSQANIYYIVNGKSWGWVK